MSEQPSPAPEPAPAPKKSQRPRGAVPKKYLDELLLAEDVAGAASKAAYVEKLQEEEVAPAQVTALQTMIIAARAQISKAGAKTTDRKVSTGSETSRKKALLALTTRVQTRAKRIYDRGHPRRDDFYIGKPIDKSRADLEQASATLIEHARSDAKLAFDAAFVARLEAARTAYVDAQGEQTGKQTDATTTRLSLADLIHAIAKARRDLQYAADTAWPAVEKVHVAIRREFKIPAHRALA